MPTSTDPERQAAGPTRSARPLHRVVVDVLVILAAAAGAIALSLWLTPMQEVSTAGQTVAVALAVEHALRLR